MKLSTLLISLLFCLSALAQTAKTDSIIPIPVDNIKAIYGHDAIIQCEDYFYAMPDDFSAKKGTEIINKTYQIVKVIKDEKYKNKQWMIFGNANDTIYYEVSNRSIENPSFVIIATHKNGKQ